ncbi:nitroreductase family protein [Flavobacteriales bacterium]|nr:nitroreductase family protein [Flavobacteriales bacterium]
MINDFNEVIKSRRSVRDFLNKNINILTVKKCIKNATLAPNSSNLQLWEFYHIINSELKVNISKACFDQPAAKTANQFVIIVTRKDLWKSRRDFNLNFILNKFKDLDDKKSIRKKKNAINYYKLLIPTLYGNFLRITGFLKYINVSIIGFFRPMYREVTSSDLRVVVHKSAALAAQNFMLSMSSSGYDTCPMEGFDSVRVKKILNLPSSAEINMIIGCGIRSEKGVYSEQFRVPFKEVYFEK